MDFQSAMETFAEAWVAANSHPPPKSGVLSACTSGNNNNNNVSTLTALASESNNNNNHNCSGSVHVEGVDTSPRSQPSPTNSAGGAVATNSIPMDSHSQSASQKCDSMLNLSISDSMTSQSKAHTPPPPRPLSPTGSVGMDLSPPNRRSTSRLSNALLKRSPKISTVSHQNPTSSPCLGKSIPIHCIVEVIVGGVGDHDSSHFSSGKNGLAINNNNNWEFGTRKPTSNTDARAELEDKEESAKDNESERETENADDDKVEKTATETEDHSNSDDEGTEKKLAERRRRLNSPPPPAPPTVSASTTTTRLEVDDFVIIPSLTRFHDVVPTVLTLLGYPHTSIRSASGSISLRNWKPLQLSQVCEPGDEDKTVGDIFNDLTHHAVLRIQIQNPRERERARSKGGNLGVDVAIGSSGSSSTSTAGASAEDLKEKLLRLLLRQSSLASYMNLNTSVNANTNAGRKDYANEDTDAGDADADADTTDEVAPPSTPPPNSTIPSKSVSGTGNQTKSEDKDGATPPWLLEDVNRRFDIWYASQHQHTIAGLVQSLLQQERQERSVNLSESSNESLALDVSSATTGNGNHHNRSRKRRSSSSSWSSEHGDGRREDARNKETKRANSSSPSTRTSATVTVNGNGCGNLLNGPLLHSTSASADKQDKIKDVDVENANTAMGMGAHYRNSLQALAARQAITPPLSSLPATLPHGASSGKPMGLPMTMQDIISHRQSQASHLAPTATPNFFLDECTNELLAAAAAAAAAAGGRAPQAHHGGPGPGMSIGGGLTHDFLRRNAADSAALHRQHQHQHQHPVFHNFTSQKTRMRTSFDPEMELPKLQAWFQENPHPSRQQIQQYVRELNLLDCRKDRKPLDVNNVIYWFKNARAAQKRNEMRYNGLPSIPGSGTGTGALNRQNQRSPMLSPYSASMAAAFHHQQQQQRSPNDMLRGHYLDARDHDHDDGDEDGSEDDDHDEYLQQQRERQQRERARTRSRSRSPHIKEEYEDGEGACPIPVNVEITEGTAARLTNGKRSDSERSRSPNAGDVGEPKDLTNSTNDKPHNRDGEQDKKDRRNSGAGIDALEDDRSNLSMSNSPTASLSPRSSSPASPGRQFMYGRDRDDPLLPNSSISPPTSASTAAAVAAAAMINRFHPFFDHPSFLAYHRHLNSLHFGTGGGITSGNPLENGPAHAHAHAQAAAYEQAVAAMALAARNGSGKGQPQSQSPGAGIFDRDRRSDRERERGAPDLYHDLPHNLLSNLRSPPITGGGRHTNPYGSLFGMPPTSTSGSSPPSQSRQSLISPPGRLGVSGPSVELISSIINSGGRHTQHDLNHQNHILGLSHHTSHQQNQGGGGGGNVGTGGSHHHSHHHSRTSPTLVLSSAALDERRKRNRTFIDPVTEVPRLEQWFTLNTHPSHNLILKYTDELNRMPYRQKFPRLEPKNVQFWFKNRRAKCKRLKMTM